MIDAKLWRSKKNTHRHSHQKHQDFPPQKFQEFPHQKTGKTLIVKNMVGGLKLKGSFGAIINLKKIKFYGTKLFRNRRIDSIRQ